LKSAPSIVLWATKRAVAERLEDWFEREGFSHAFKRALTIESLHQAACVYARTALTICG
jgi:hypothetical protein